MDRYAAVIIAASNCLRLPMIRLRFFLTGCLLLSLAPLSLMPHTLPRAYAAAGPRLVVLPFQLLGPDQGEAWIGDSFAEYLTLALSQADSLTLIERAQLDKVLKEQGFGQSALADEASAPQLGRLLGAQQLVMGSLQRQGDQLLVSLRRVDASSGRVIPGSALQLQGPQAELNGLQQNLALQLLQSLTSMPESRARELVAGMTPTSSAKASEAYHRALERLRNFSDGHLSEAIDLLTQAVNLDPGYTLAYAALSEAYALRVSFKEFMSSARPDDMDQALHFAQRALAQGNHPAAVYRALARAHFARGHHPEALKAIEQALAHKPGDSLSIQAWLQYRGRDNPPLVQLRQELRQLGADLQDGVLMLDLAHRELNELKRQARPDVAPLQDMLLQLQQREPRNPFVLNKLAEVAILAGQPEQGVRYVDQALALEPDNYLLLFNAGAILFKLPDQQARVEAAFKRAIALNPRFGFSHLFLGMFYMSQQRKAEAHEILLTAQQALPHSAFVPMILGQLALLESNPAQAHAYYLKALANHDKVLGETIEFGDLLTALIETGHAVGRPETENYIERLLQGGRGIGPGHYRKLVAKLAAWQDFNRAQAVFQRYTQQPGYSLVPEDERLYQRLYLLQQLQASPQNPALLNDLGRLALIEQDLDTAEHYLGQAMALDSQEPAIGFNLGLLRLQQERFAEAAGLFEQVLASQPKHTKARFNLGQAKLRLGLKTEARAIFQALLQAEPSHAEALKALEQLGP